MRQDLQITPSVKADSREVELKFLTTESGFKASQQWPALAPLPRRRNAQHLVAWYYDTEDADLERHSIVLRVRKQGRAHIMALKWQGSFPSLFERGEVEATLPGPEPDPSLFGPEYAAMLGEIIQGKALVPIYETDIRRMIRHVTSDSGDIEVAFDSGFIRAGDQKLPVREIELELKSGDTAELCRLGMSLASTYPVRLGILAKSQRGMQLRSGMAPGIVRAVSPLDGNPTVDESIGALINSCMAQFTGNFPAFESGDQVTAVHQMRVAMRRLRAVLKLFQRGFPGAEFTAFGLQAKQIAAILGGARNWDVFLQLLRNGPAGAFPEQPGFAPIILGAEQHRASGYDSIHKLLAAAETTCFVLGVQAFVARRGWRNTLSGEALSRLTGPAKLFAEANLRRMHGKLLKQGKHLQSLPPHERHKIRIGLKNIRYGGEMFSALFEPRKELRDFLRQSARLQDMLGSTNDLITALDLLGKLETSDPSANYAAGIIAGWCRFGAMPNDELLLKSWKKFRKARLPA